MGENEPQVPLVAWQRELAERAATEIPFMLKTGRYLFFGLCSLGLSVLPYVLLREVGLGKQFAAMASNAAFLVSFIALRDMSKPWDVARRAAAAAMVSKQEQSK